MTNTDTVASRTHRYWRGLLAALAALMQLGDALAYQTDTHEELSERGFVQSTKTARTFTDLGLSPTAALLGERRDGLGGLGNASLIPLRWIRAGAHDEDDTSSEIVARYLNHFYDPTPGAPNNGGLSGLLNGLPAPDWSLEPTEISGQNYSYRDARENFRTALGAPSKADREKNLAKAFYALGHVVHTVQDLAQPQHTRNDPHLISLYETFTNQVVRQQIDGVPPLKYDGGPIPLVTVPRSLWTDQAVYSNRNFLSAGAGGNFRFQAGSWLPSANYANPKPFGTTEEVAVAQLPGINSDISTWCAAQNCLMRFISSRDEAGGAVMKRAATHSILTQDLALDPANTYQVTLNRFNFAAAHQELIPRAVSYTTALLDYFFRGSLAATPLAAGSFSISNLSAEAMLGDFGLYYDDADGNRIAVTITRCRVGDAEIAVSNNQCKAAALPSAAERLIVDFTEPTAPAPKTAGEYMLVFAGQLGEEKPDNGSIGAVVGKLIRGPVYNGVLYVAGVDANNDIVSFKIDTGGVSIVSGWDVSKASPANPQGVLVSNGGKFDPLGRAYAVAKAGNNPLATSPKIYTTKQVEFESTAAGLVHRWASLTVYVPSTFQLGGQISEHFSYTPNFPASPQRGRIFWTAKSPDPAIGNFEFLLLGTQQVRTVSFTRRFTLAGEQQTAFGSFNLPVPGTRLFQASLTNPGGQISGDGTLIELGSLPFGDGGQRRSRIRINLAETPSATLETIDYPMTRVDQPSIATTAEAGKCTLTYVDDRGQTQVSEGVRTFTSAAPGGTSTAFDGEMPIAYFGDVRTGVAALATYRVTSQTAGVSSGSSGGCFVGAQDFNGPVRVHIEASGDHTFSRSGSNAYTFTDGGLVTIVGPPNLVPFVFQLAGRFGNPPLAGIGSYNISYEGLDPPPPFQVTDLREGPRTWTVFGLSHPLTARLRDAVATESPNESAPFVSRFRDIDISGRRYLGDGSPLGEVFFATEDLSDVVHEPLPGGMPVLTRDKIPANIVRLLAAVWL